MKHIGWIVIITALTLLIPKKLSDHRKGRADNKKRRIVEGT
jgi:hypothetical protein